MPFPTCIEMVKFEGTKLKVLLVADADAVVRSLFQKRSSSIFPPLLPFPWSSNISASELDPEQCWPPINVRGFRAADGYGYVLLSKVFLSERIFTDTNPLIFVCLAAELHVRA